MKDGAKVHKEMGEHMSRHLEPITPLVEEKVLYIFVGLIDPDPDQPRRYFSEEDLQTLARSIDLHTQVTAAFVRPHPNIPGRFIIIYGERRWRSISQYCERTKHMRCIVIEGDITEDQILDMQCIENVHRKDLFPLELADLMKRLKDKGKTLQQVADRTDMSVGSVVNYLSLLNLIPDVQALMSPERAEKDRLAVITAVAISRVPENLQLEMAEYAITRGVSLMQIRDRIDLLARDGHIEQSGKKQIRLSPFLSALTRLDTILDIRFRAYEDVRGAFLYGKKTVGEMEVIKDRVRELIRKLELMCTRLERAIETKKKSSK